MRLTLISSSARSGDRLKDQRFHPTSALKRPYFIPAFDSSVSLLALLRVAVRKNIRTYVRIANCVSLCRCYYRRRGRVICHFCLILLSLQSIASDLLSSIQIAVVLRRLKHRRTTLFSNYLNTISFSLMSLLSFSSYTSALFINHWIVSSQPRPRKAT